MAAVLESERRVREAGVDAAAAAPLYTQMKPACSGLDFGGGNDRKVCKQASVKKFRLKKKMLMRPEQPVDVAGRKQQAA